MMTPHLLKNKKIYPLLLSVILLLLVTACTGVVASPVEHPPLKISWNYWPGSYPLVIAQELGLFEKHGVKVEPILVEYESHAPDFIAKKTDGVLFTLADALAIDAREPDSARIVLVYDESAGADVVVATADIANIADLKNKRIGASSGSFGELLVQTMLQAGNLTPDQVTLVDLGPEAVPDSMPALAQAGFTFEPHLSQAIAQGHHIIFSSAEAPGLISDVVIFRTEVVQQRPEDVRAFVTAWFEAVDYWQAHPAEGNALIAKTLNLPVEEISLQGLKLLTREDNQRAFERNTDPTSLYTSAQINADFLISSGTLNNAPDLKRLLDPSFLK